MPYFYFIQTNSEEYWELNSRQLQCVKPWVYHGAAASGKLFVLPTNSGHWMLHCSSWDETNYRSLEVQWRVLFTAFLVKVIMLQWWAHWHDAHLGRPAHIVERLQSLVASSWVLFSHFRLFSYVNAADISGHLSSEISLSEPRKTDQMQIHTYGHVVK